MSWFVHDVQFWHYHILWHDVEQWATNIIPEQYTALWRQFHWNYYTANTIIIVKSAHQNCPAKGSNCLLEKYNQSLPCGLALQNSDAINKQLLFRENLLLLVHQEVIILPVIKNGVMTESLNNNVCVCYFFKCGFACSVLWYMLYSILALLARGPFLYVRIWRL